MRKTEPPLQVGVEGLGLFETPAPLARSTDPATSHAAAASMVDAAGAQRRAILNYLEAHPEGATADELDDRLGWRPSTAGRRLGELLALGLAVRMDGLEGRERLTRPTRQGRQAFVHQRA